MSEQRQRKRRRGGKSRKTVNPNHEVLYTRDTVLNGKTITVAAIRNERGLAMTLFEKREGGGRGSLIVIPAAMVDEVMACASDADDELQKTARGE